MRKNQNWNKQRNNFNNKNRKPKKEEHYLDKFKGSIEVRNGDVNGALRKLKKTLENADRAKELAKREFYEKPSARRKRARDAAIKRSKREQQKLMFSGDAPVTEVTGFSFMKSKRKRRKYSDLKNQVAMIRRKNGH